MDTPKQSVLLDNLKKFTHLDLLLQLLILLLLLPPAGCYCSYLKGHFLHTSVHPTTQTTQLDINAADAVAVISAISVLSFVTVLTLTHKRARAHAHAHPLENLSLISVS